MASQDIDPSGDPGPDDDEAGRGVTAPNNEPMSMEQGEGATNDAGEEFGDVDEIQEDLEETAQNADPAPGEDSPEDSEDASPPDDGEAPPPPPEATKTDFLPAPLPPPPDAGADIPPAGEVGAEAGAEAPAPSEEELGGIEEDLAGFGEKLNQFNEAGGAGGGAATGIPGESGDGPTGPLGEFADAAVSWAATANDFLTDHARMLNDLQRKLELERL